MNFKQLGSYFVAPNPAYALSHTRVKMYWWSGKPNVGDAISPFLVSALSEREVVSAKKREHPKLLAVGSLMHYARAGDIIWGTGCISEDTKIKTRRLHVTAVRGPRTRELLLKRGVDCPEVYGDPAILLPRFLAAKVVKKKHRLGVIPHYMDREEVVISDPAVKVISVALPAEEFISEILSCERVISSSLHGIILAEAYGVAADWIKFSDRLLGQNFKFDDYFEGTGREAIEPLSADSIFLEREHPQAKFNVTGLIEAFPFSPKM
ncbi:MAG: polysaccharide pyruvyl transferase family protein [Gammaproteobacteria bacterium]|nr:polysaccharide pyruvyl transferase family protein [Gammaproteobacteria bacterium]MCW8971760.1 polysaccharide pyruvyl transferase family protein [Gammaproteobacteria bacterium]MCW8993335.1 polysaccharide pyruvyl transferase family protein [Gammaproteobacteria bacterium]